MIASLPRREDVRLLTLTGPAGVGKTRLALHVAQTPPPDIEHGVRFIPLAQVDDPNLVGPAPLERLGPRPAGGDADSTAALIAYLRPRPALLVPDNFEQVLAAAPSNLGEITDGAEVWMGQDDPNDRSPSADSHREETEMTRETMGITSEITTETELTRAALDGALSRRELIKRGRRAGLGLAAVAALALTPRAGSDAAAKGIPPNCIYVCCDGTCDSWKMCLKCFDWPKPPKTATRA